MASSSSTTTSPVTILNDAAAAFIKQANYALSVTEEACRVRVAASDADVSTAQEERDALRREHNALMQDKLELVKDAERAKLEMERWKASNEKAERTVSHQAETIKQLRREAQQWREQFLRVDEDRMRLSSRVDELVMDQLSIYRQDALVQEPLTPRSQGHHSSAPTSTNKHLASPSCAANEYEYERAESQRSRMRMSTLPKEKGVSHPPPQTTLIRRVHTVVTVPVKEENPTDDICEDEDIDSCDQTPAQASEQQNVARSSSRLSRKRTSNKEGVIARRRKGARPVICEDSSDEQSDYSGDDSVGDDGNDPSYVLNAPRDDDDEDELMIGVEDNRNELYGPGRAVTASRMSSPARRAQTHLPSGKPPAHAAKKRNLTHNPTQVNKRIRKR